MFRLQALFSEQCSGAVVTKILGEILLDSHWFHTKNKIQTQDYKLGPLVVVVPLDSSEALSYGCALKRCTLF